MLLLLLYICSTGDNQISSIVSGYMSQMCSTFSCIYQMMSSIFSCIYQISSFISDCKYKNIQPHLWLHRSIKRTVSYEMNHVHNTNKIIPKQRRNYTLWTTRLDVYDPQDESTDCIGGVIGRLGEAMFPETILFCSYILGDVKHELQSELGREPERKPEREPKSKREPEPEREPIESKSPQVEPSGYWGAE